MKKIEKILIATLVILAICQISYRVYAYTLIEAKNLVEFKEMAVDERPKEYDVEINAEDLIAIEEIPCITKTIESIIYGNKGFFNINFFDSSATNTNMSEAWKKLAKIVQVVFKLSLYIAMALMLTLLIYIAIMLVSYGISNKKIDGIPIPLMDRFRGVKSKVIIEQWFSSVVILALMAFIITILTSFSGIIIEWADGLRGANTENYITVFVKNAKKSTRSSSTYSGEQSISNLSSDVSNMLGETKGNWAVYARNFDSGMEAVTYNSNVKMPAASVMKLFIASVAYQKEATDKNDKSKASKDKYKVNESDMSKMITVSDNDAANRIIESLGGLNKVKVYIHQAGYSATDLNRKFGTTDYTKDNLTSVDDVGALLTAIYGNTCKGASKILDYMKKQERTNKIPQGVKKGTTVANKTGELDSSYRTGPAENDAAIVYKKDANYCLVIFSNGIDSGDAINKIIEISKKVYDDIDGVVASAETKAETATDTTGFTKSFNYTFKTGIEGLFMFQSQYNWEEYARQNFMYIFLGSLITIFKIAVYAILWIRTIIIAVLVAIAPIVVLINAFMKVTGNKKSPLTWWLKIFVYLALLRAAVALIYYILVNSNPYLINEYPYYIIFVIVAMTGIFIYSVKKLERSFGFNGLFTTFKKKKEKKKKKKKKIM